jgi:hypothetical protein
LASERLHINDWPILEVTLAGPRAETYDLASERNLKSFCETALATSGHAEAAMLALDLDAMADTTGRGPAWKKAHCGPRGDPAERLLCEVDRGSLTQPQLLVTVWIQPIPGSAAAASPNNLSSELPIVGCRGGWPVAGQRYCVAPLEWREGLSLRFAFKMPALDQAQATALARGQALALLSALFGHA